MSNNPTPYIPADRWPSLHARGEYEGKRCSVVRESEMKGSMRSPSGNYRAVAWMHDIKKQVEEIRDAGKEFGHIFDYLYEEKNGKPVVKDMRQFRDLNFTEEQKKQIERKIEWSVKCSECEVAPGQSCKDGRGRSVHTHASRKRETKGNIDTVQKLFNTDFDYFFKVWLQYEYERMIVGDRSIYILKGPSRSQEEEDSEKIWHELAVEVHEQLSGLIGRDEKTLDDLLSMIQHANMIQIMEGKYIDDEELDFRDGVTYKICRMIVRSLLEGSRVKSRKEKEKWKVVYRSKSKPELVEFATQKIDSNGNKKELIERLISNEIKPKQEWLNSLKEDRSVPLMGFLSKMRGNLSGPFKNLEKELNSFPTLIEKIFSEGSEISDVNLSGFVIRDEEQRAVFERIRLGTTDTNTIAKRNSRDIDGEQVVTWLKGCGESQPMKAKIKKRFTELISEHVEENDVEKFVQAFDRFVKFREKGWPGGYKTRAYERFSDAQKRLSKIDHQLLRFSQNIVTLLLTELEWVYLDEGNWGDIADHWDAEGDGGALYEQWSGKSPPNMIRFESGFLERFVDTEGKSEHAIFRTLKQDARRWMYCEPEKHRDVEWVSIADDEIERPEVKPGGFVSTGHDRGHLVEKLGRVVLNNELYDKLEEMHDDFKHRTLVGKECIDALNHLQQTQWEVNLDFLQVIAIPAHTRVPELMFETAVPGKKYETEELWKPMREKGVQWKELRFKKWLEKCRERDACQEDRGRKRKWELWDHTLNNARKAIGNVHNVFWHSWAVDYRGRFLPRAPLMSPQGDDLDRALIRFKEWKPLGRDGVRWFYIHICNLFSKQKWAEGSGHHWEGRIANSKWSFEKRYQWTKSNVKKLREIAQNFQPIEQSHEPDEAFTQILGLQGKPSSGGEAFQRLATILELDRIHSVSETDEVKLEAVESGQPVYLDASNNGFQHAAALLRHKELGEAVNIVKSPNGDEQDLYQRVADEALQRFQDCAKKTKFRIELERLAESEELKEILSEPKKWEIVFDRKMMKIPTMVAAYGAKDLLKCFIGRDGKGKPGFREKTPLTVDQECGPEEYPYTCQRNRKGSFGKSIRLADGVWGIPKCEQVINNKEEYVKHMNEVHPWAPKLHVDSPLVRAIEDHRLVDVDYENWDQTYQIQFVENEVVGYKQEGLNQILYDLSVQLTADVQSVIETVTAKAYAKIGQRGLIKIHDREFELDQKHGGLIWNTGTSGKRSPKLQGMRIQNFDITPESKNKVSPWKLWNCPTSDSEAKLYPEICNFFDEQGIKFDEKLPEMRASSSSGEIKRFKNKALRKLREVSQQNGVEDEVKEQCRQYMRRLVQRYNVNWDDLSKYESTEKGKSATRSATPNFIHSLDAAHMRNVILKLNRKGIKDIWAVHDCFGTHACNIENMRTVVKDCFMQLHRDKHLGQWLIQLDRGGFDIQEMSGRLDSESGGLSDHINKKTIPDMPDSWKKDSDTAKSFQEKIPLKLQKKLQGQWDSIVKNIGDPNYAFGIHFAWIEYLAMLRRVCVILYMCNWFENNESKLSPEQQNAKKDWEKGDWEKAVDRVAKTVSSKWKVYKKFKLYESIYFDEEQFEISKDLKVAELKEMFCNKEWVMPQRKNKAEFIAAAKKCVREDWLKQLWKKYPGRIWKLPSHKNGIDLAAPSHRNIGEWDEENREFKMLDLSHIDGAEFIIS